MNLPQNWREKNEDGGEAISWRRRRRRREDEGMGGPTGRGMGRIHTHIFGGRRRSELCALLL